MNSSFYILPGDDYGIFENLLNSKWNGISITDGMIKKQSGVIQQHTSLIIDYYYTMPTDYDLYYDSVTFDIIKPKNQIFYDLSVHNHNNSISFTVGVINNVIIEIFTKIEEFYGNALPDNVYGILNQYEKLMVTADSSENHILVTEPIGTDI